MARRRKRNHYRDTGFARGGITTFYKFPPGTSEDIIDAAKEALKEGVDDVVADAKSRCPVDTGRLRDSIKAESNDEGTYYYISANASVPTKNPYSKDDRFYYGAVVEFSPKINKPFLYPALEAHGKEIRMNIRKAVMQAIRAKYKFRRGAA